MLNAILTVEMAYLAFDALMEVSRWFSPLTGPQYTNQTQITVIRGAAGSRCFGRIRIRVLMKEKKNSGLFRRVGSGCFDRIRISTLKKKKTRIRIRF